MLTSTDMVGKRIRALRESRGLKQSEVADKIGMQRSSYSKVEAGIYVLQPDYCVELAELFDTSCDYILRGIEAENLHFSKESGFSNKAIDVLKKAEDRWCYANFLNRLLECDEFSTIAHQYMAYHVAEYTKWIYNNAPDDENLNEEYWESMGIPVRILKKKDERIPGIAKNKNHLFHFTIPNYLNDKVDYELYRLVKSFENAMNDEERWIFNGHKPDESD